MNTTQTAAGPARAAQKLMEVGRIVARQVGMILLALALACVFLACSGYPPFAVLQGVWQSLTSDIAGTVRWATPLILAGLAMCVTQKAQVFNRGADGQIYLGAAAATAVAMFVPFPNPVVALLCVLLAAAVAGQVEVVVHPPAFPQTDVDQELRGRDVEIRCRAFVSEADLSRGIPLEPRVAMGDQLYPVEGLLHQLCKWRKFLQPRMIRLERLLHRPGAVGNRRQVLRREDDALPAGGVLGVVGELDGVEGPDVDADAAHGENGGGVAGVAEDDMRLNREYALHGAFPLNRKETGGSLSRSRWEKFLSQRREPMPPAAPDLCPPARPARSAPAPPGRRPESTRPGGSGCWRIPCPDPSRQRTAAR